MSGSTKTDVYKPTAAQKKLLEVLVNPENVGLSVTEVCRLAEIHRDTYYKAMKNQEFKDLVAETTMDCIKGKVSVILNATFLYALNEKGHQDRKMLLTMMGMYSDKQVTEIKGEMTVNNPVSGLTTEELRKLIALEEKQGGG